MGRKNISKGKNKDLTDFSYLISEAKDIKAKNNNEIKESDKKED